MSRQHRTGYFAAGRRRTVIVVLIALVVSGCLLLAAGCSGSHDVSVNRPAAPQTTDSTTAAATTTSADSTTFSNTASGTIADEQGNSAEVTVGVSSPQPLEKLSDPVATACNQEITNAGASLGSAVAIPMHVTAQLTSSLKTPLVVNLNETGSEVALLETRRQEVEPLTNSHLSALWAMSYSTTGPQCSPLAEAQWTAEAITPHATETWETWLIIAGAITPNDPSGEQTTNNLLITPRATIASGAPANLTPQGSGWVRCSTNDAGYVAVNPVAVKRDGCKA